MSDTQQQETQQPERTPTPVMIFGGKDASVGGLEIVTQGSHMSSAASLSVAVAGGQPPLVTIVALPGHIDVHFKALDGKYKDQILRLQAGRTFDPENKEKPVSYAAVVTDAEGKPVDDIAVVNLVASSESPVVQGRVMTVDEAREALLKVEAARKKATERPD